MSAIEACRTAELGGHIERCEDCAHTQIAYNSCRNRHCPKCQGAAARAWLAERQADLLPVPYYHVVFTLPAAVASLAFHNKAVVYDLMVKATAETLQTIAADPKHLGARIGLTAVLHTWGSALTHHPHVHCIVPGGGLSADGQRWIACRPGFFLPVRVLSRLFRRLFLNKLEAAHAAGRLVFFGDLAPLAEPTAFAAHLRPLRRAEWVVYAKRPVRRARGGARLSRPLHPPRGDRQQPPRQPRCARRELPLEGLPGPDLWQGLDQDHDPAGRRVPAPLPAPRPAVGLPPHPPLRPPRRRRPRRHRPHPYADRPALGQDRARRRAGQRRRRRARRFRDHLPMLRRAHAPHRDLRPQQGAEAARDCAALGRHVMSPTPRDPLLHTPATPRAGAGIPRASASRPVRSAAARPRPTRSARAAPPTAAAKASRNGPADHGRGPSRSSSSPKSP